MKSQICLILALLAISSQAASITQLQKATLILPSSPEKEILLTANTNIGKNVIAYHKTSENVLYFSFTGYDHSTKKLWLTLTEAANTKSIAVWELPIISDMNSDGNIPLTLKKYTGGGSLADIEGKTVCQDGKYDYHFNTLIIKCTWTSEPYSSSDFDNVDAAEWRALGINKKWGVLEHTAFTYSSLVYASSSAVIAQYGTGVELNDYWKLDPTENIRLQFDRNNVGATTKFSIAFPTGITKKHVLVTLGKTSDGNYDAIHLYKQGSLWFVGSNVLTSAADTKVNKWGVPTVSMKAMLFTTNHLRLLAQNSRMLSTAASYFVQFEKTFAGASASATNSVTPSDAATKVREVIIGGKDSYITNDADIFKFQFTQDLSSDERAHQKVGYLLPETLSDKIGGMVIHQDDDISKRVFIKYAYIKDNDFVTDDSYDHIVISVGGNHNVRPNYSKSWFGFGKEISANKVHYIAANFDTTNYICNPVTDSHSADISTDFATESSSSNVAGTIVGCIGSLNSGYNEITFKIPKTATDTTNDASFDNMHSTATKLHFFASETNSEATGIGKLSAAIEKYTVTATFPLNKNVTRTVTEYSNPLSMNPFSTSDIDIGSNTNTKFNGKYAYVDSNGNQLEFPTSNVANEKIQFEYSFKLTSNAALKKIYGITYGTSIDSDIHIFDFQMMSLYDCHISTGIDLSANPVEGTATLDGSSTVKATLKAFQIVSVASPTPSTTITLLVERAHTGDSATDLALASDTSVKQISNVYGFFDEDSEQSVSKYPLVGAVYSASQTIDISYKPVIAGSLTPSQVLFTEQYGIKITYNFVDGVSSQTVLTTLDQIKSASDAYAKLYVKLPDDTTDKTKYIFFGVKGSGSTYHGVSISRTTGQVYKVDIEASGTPLKFKSISASSTSIINTQGVYDSGNKLVTFFVKRDSFGYSNGAFNEVEAIVGSGNVAVSASELTSNVNDPFEVKTTPSVSSSGIIAKATLMMVAIIFLYFC